MSSPRILLLDDDKADRTLLSRAIRRAHPLADITCTSTVAEFWNELDHREFDCTLIDFHLGSAQADTLLTSLAERQPPCPAIVVSGSSEQEVVVRTMRSGAADFVPKDDAFDGCKLWQRMVLAMRAVRREHHERRRQRRREQRLLDLSRRDPLTGLLNRRAVESLLNSTDRRTLDRRGTVAAIMCDVDHFKQHNDLCGHSFGDRVLHHLAGTLHDLCRPTDMASRWGGEEFLIVKRECSLPQAVSWSETTRAAIAGMRLEHDSRPVPVTASFGVACVESPCFSAGTIDLADQAMYLAKHRGRNRVDTWQMVAFVNMVREIPAAPVAQRFRSLLRRAGDSLGPVQLEHLTSHSRHVSDAAVQLGRALGTGADGIEVLWLSGLLHDIAKLNMPEGLLAKTYPLSPDELTYFSRRGEDGAEMAKTLGAPDAVTDTVRHQVCRFDVPMAQRQETPQSARIISVADAYVTMVSGRPYQPRRTTRQAKAELVAHSGRQFDPAVVNAAVHTLHD